MNMRDSIAAARISGPIHPPEGMGAVAWFEFCFRGDDPTFAGHFPGRPLLPGTFQLELARHSAELSLGCPVALREVPKAKFLRPIMPGEMIQVELKHTEAAGAIQARVRVFVANQPAAEMLLTLARLS
jgi:3-hydroxymyristoyl/3-hydroxydecanoyl-(acyl carrier protein) dehydratase